jgi:hypothetical protein
MKRTIFVLLLLTASTFGQQRSLATLTTRTEVPVPPGSVGTVTLSLAEYDRLIELATRKPKAADAAPLPFVLSRASIKLRVEDQILLGTVDFDGSVLESGPSRVPLIRGLTVLQAQRSGNALPLIQDQTMHAAILNGPADFSLSLSVAAPIAVEAGRASFVLPVPVAGSSLFSLDLPGNHADIRLEPGVVTSRTTENGHTIVEATLEPGKPTRVWWTTREMAAPVAQREVRFLSDIKSVVSVGDSQLRVTALCDVAIIQGEAQEFRMPLPAGFELVEATGSTLDTSEMEGGTLVLKVREPAKRNHQFLIAIERANPEAKAEAPLLALNGAQHETGELLVEGLGAMELTPSESGGLRRIDVREAGAIARALVHFPLQAAFRYNRRAGDTPKLQLAWTQFPDSQVLAAIAEKATITTLTNVEGKSLTEVTLRVRNHSQPFVKVELPAGAQLLSAEVEGERVKPVQGADGSRVPLLRAGLNPQGVYTVSFVYLQAGTRFAKAGSYEMALPKLDIPVSLLTWEVSLPERLEVRQFGGNALAAELFPAAAQSVLVNNSDDFTEEESNAFAEGYVDIVKMDAGQIGGIVADPNGAVVPGAAITVVNKQTGASQSTKSDGEGRWIVSGMQPGPIKVSVAVPGFKMVQHELELTVSKPARLGTTVEPASVTETVTVTSDGAALEREGRRIEEQARKNQQALLNTPSQNVFNLQRRVAGILPVRVEVPRSGKSYRFVRPLVLEDETKISFQYKSR